MFTYGQKRWRTLYIFLLGCKYLYANIFLWDPTVSGNTFVCSKNVDAFIIIRIIELISLLRVDTLAKHIYDKNLRDDENARLHRLDFVVLSAWGKCLLPFLIAFFFVINRLCFTLGTYEVGKNKLVIFSNLN